MRIAVGRIGKAHGIRGAVFITPFTDEPDQRFVVGESLFAGNPANRHLTLSQVRDHSGRLVVEFEGITDRNQAEALRGSELVLDIDPAELPDGEDEYYDRQLIGLAVRVGEESVGTVTDVIHLPGHDLLAVDLANGDERLVPFVSEICPEVNLDEGFVRVDPPPGLLDDQAEEAGDASAN